MRESIKVVMHGSAAELFASVACYLAQEPINNLRIAVVDGNFVTVVFATNSELHSTHFLVTLIFELIYVPCCIVV